MTALYNEIEPFAADWIESLARAGHVAAGRVERRSIVDLAPGDVDGYNQCHFFAGIGGWSRALRLAGWPDDRQVWTGSCPCQPFSSAGRGGGFADDRHLWPAWFSLIRECRPAVVFGEQVASPAGLAWLDAVQADLEGAGYAVGAADLCAAGVGAPHIRQRLYFVAYASGDERGPGRRRGAVQGIEVAERAPLESAGRRDADLSLSLSLGLADGHAPGRREQRCSGVPSDVEASRGDDVDGRGAASRLAHDDDDDRPQGRSSRSAAPTVEREGTACELVDASGTRRDDAKDARTDRGDARPCTEADERRAAGDLESERAGATSGFWADCEWVPCRDGKVRPVEPGTFPLAHGIPGRVGRLRGYGNAIVPPLAAEFVAAAMDLID